MKAKYFDIKNVATSLKGIGVGMATSLVIVIPLVTARHFNQLTMPMVAILFGLLTVTIYLFTWGYLAKRFWGWKWKKQI